MPFLFAASCLLQTAAVVPPPGPHDTDWPAFRGGALQGNAPAGLAPPPDEWSDEKNLAWRTPLPGPGSSSPIVVGDRVYLTAWSGYGLSTETPGDRDGLERHLVCCSLEDGALLFDRGIDAAVTEDPYEGRLTTHGYASSTPVSDGERVIVFFGKRGVLCFDLDGELDWSAEVGSGSSEWNTGSAPSPAIVGDLVIVAATDESATLYAFDKVDGSLVWKREDEALELAFDTPVEAQGLILFALLEQVWGVDPKDGSLRFRLRTQTNGSLAPTLVVGGDVFYSIGGQSGTRGYAVRLGGEGDVTDSHVLWSNRNGSYVTSPVLVGDALYWVDERGMAHCMDTATGELRYRERLPSDSFYASVLHAGNRLYCVSRTDGTFVLPAEPRFEVLAHNRFSDPTRFDGSPAPADGRLLLRSGEALYCVEDQGD